MASTGQMRQDGERSRPWKLLVAMLRSGCFVLHIEAQSGFSAAGTAMITAVCWPCRRQLRGEETGAQQPNCAQ